jgi:hypothetical protein
MSRPLLRSGRNWQLAIRHWQGTVVRAPLAEEAGVGLWA